MCGAFFLVQPLFIVVERWMKVRQWRPAARRAWTLTCLTIASPLFVEPALQIIEPSWGATDNVLAPTMFALGFAIIINVFFSVGQLASCPRFRPTTPRRSQQRAFARMADSKSPIADLQRFHACGHSRRGSALDRPAT
jgi:hypothetical protein